MPRDQKRYLLVILLLVAAVAGMVLINQRSPLSADVSDGYELVADIDNWQRTERERIVRSSFNFSLAANLADLPLTLGKWRGTDVPQTNLEVFILLEPEQYVQRQYDLPDGRFVWLSLIGSHKSKSFHPPPICYEADGWQTDVSSEAVPLAEGEIYALRLVARKSFPSGGHAEHIALYFFLWPSPDRNSQDGTVFLKVTAPPYGTVEDTVALEKEFLRLLFKSARQIGS